MNYKPLWSNLRQGMDVLWKSYLPAMEKTATDLGVKRRTLGLLLAAVIFEPEPISEPLLQRRNPYQAFNNRLFEAAAQGFFQESLSGKYLLTNSGGHAAAEIIRSAYDVMRALPDPFPSPDFTYFIELLRKIVTACLEISEPPGKWCINHSRRLDPGGNAPLIIRLDQYLSDLLAYHDDAHLAAWQPLGVDGPTWETLTMVNSGEVDSLNMLIKRLKFRDFPSSVYENAVESLANDGMLMVKNSKITLTEKGRVHCQKVEEKTDHYFFAPWEFLSQEDVEILENLSKNLVTKLGESKNYY
ncbi:MAG: hypothetical protein J7L73_03170 [Anaerolineales bacterium]|nr:hypothetical protein [Anaerolineales bacterium]